MCAENAKHYVIFPQTYVNRLGDLDAFYVDCFECDRRGPTKPTTTEAVEAWNALVEDTLQWGGKHPDRLGY
jgi:hypothetical protein